MPELDPLQVSNLLAQGELLTLKEVAKGLNRAYSTVWWWVKQGRVEGVRLGKRVYIYRKSLERFLAGKDP